MQVKIANPLAGGRAKSFLSQKLSAYFLFDSMTSDSILLILFSFYIELNYLI